MWQVCFTVLQIALQYFCSGFCPDNRAIIAILQRRDITTYTLPSAHTHLYPLLYPAMVLMGINIPYWEILTKLLTYKSKNPQIEVKKS
jgi:hypothetical protein